MKILISLFSRLSMRALYVLSDYMLYPIMYYVIRYRRKLSYRNIQSSFPEKSDKEVVAIQKRFYHQLANVIVEIIHAYRASDDEILQAVQFQSVDLIERLASQNQGVIILLGHLGNWEYLAHIQPHYTLENIQNYNVYRQLKNKTADQLMLNMRERFCGKGSCIEKRNLLRHLITIRKQQNPFSFALLADQKPSPGNDYYWLDFLHHDTGFLGGAEVLAKKFGFAVVYSHISLVERGKYAVQFSTITDQPANESPYYITEQFAKRLEKNIQEQPELWLWTHNRWKWARNGVRN